jgi:MoxR-like ATPase
VGERDNVTDDKNFKKLVREEARRSGRAYTDVRARLRPPGPDAPTPPAPAEEVADRFEAIVAAIEQHIYGKHETVRLVATALLVPGNALFTDVHGNGMTALAMGVAAAIGAEVVSVDGRTGLDLTSLSSWGPDDVVVVSHFDGLTSAEQTAVIEAQFLPAIVLAKRHPIPDRMPHPPDDDTRERFLFGLNLGYADADTEFRIVSAVRDGGAQPSSPADPVSPQQLSAMRAAARAVDVPDEVRRFAVAAVASTRADEALLMGASAGATIALVQGAAAVAVADGRNRAQLDDAAALVRAAISHRVVFRPDVEPDLDEVVARALQAASV